MKVFQFPCFKSYLQRIEDEVYGAGITQGLVTYNYHRLLRQNWLKSQVSTVCDAPELNVLNTNKMLENSFVLQTINTVKNPDNSLKCSSQFCFVRADMEQTSLKIFNSERRVICEQGDTFMISHIFTQYSGGIPVHKIIIIYNRLSIDYQK